MNEQVTLRVRPGFVHGAQREFQEGALLFVDETEALQLLASFGDKLEQVGDAYQTAGFALEGSSPKGDEPEPAADILPAAEILPVAEPRRLQRNRKAGGP